MRAAVERVERLLETGRIEVLGLMPGASNETLAVSVENGGARAIAVYKPRDGETPLWDFPDGTLYRREVAAYVLSRALGWPLVPPTVTREGPHGIGSLQLYIDAHPDRHYLTMMPARAEDFRLVAAFDVVVNNADRKSGHCLLEKDTDRIWVVDHGVCFHAEPKLRTVIWDFVGEPVPETVREQLRALSAVVPADLAALLAPEEVDALRERARALADAGVLPPPEEGRRPYPWPPV